MKILKYENYELLKYLLNCGIAELRKSNKIKLVHRCRRRLCRSPSDPSGLAIPDGYILPCCPRRPCHPRHSAVSVGLPFPVVPDGINFSGPGSSSPLPVGLFPLFSPTGLVSPFSPRATGETPPTAGTANSEPRIQNRETRTMSAANVSYTSVNAAPRVQNSL